MAIIKKDGNFMGLPMNIARGNPIPLDNSEIWYSKDEMLNYAATNPVAYVGQILGLVDEVDNTAKAYIILNADGDVQEVGKATVVDNVTIVLDDDDTLSLKDFGKKYYEYIAEENGVAAHYVERIVDEEHPWIAGLEPRVVLEGTKFVLGWYQPNPTTMEGVNNQIAGIQTSVSALTTATANLSERLDNTYTKSETDSAIAEKVAAAAHLKRKKVSSVSDIDPEAADAEQYIYMVPIGITDDDNKYTEYIVIDGEVEPVGTWEVNLDDYATKQHVQDTYVQKDVGKDLVSLSDIAKLTTVSENAERNIINSVSGNFNIDANDRQLQLVSIPTSLDLSQNTSLLQLFVQKETDKTLIGKSDLIKLNNIEDGAQKNFINDVSNEFSVSNDEKKLTIAQVDGNKIINLTNNTDFNTVRLNLITVSNDTADIKSKLDTMSSTLVNINANFNNYVLKTEHNKDMSDIWEHLTWHEIQ